MPRSKSIKTKVKNKLYFHSRDEVPEKLIMSIIECSSGFGERCEFGIGLMGLVEQVVKDLGLSKEDVEELEKNISAGIQAFVTYLNKIRYEYPSMTLQEWYMFALAVYNNGSPAMQEIENTKTKSWSEYRYLRKPGFMFAERVWQTFKEMGGRLI